MLWKERKMQTNWTDSIQEPLLFEVKSVPKVSQRKKSRERQCNIQYLLRLSKSVFAPYDENASFPVFMHGYFETGRTLCMALSSALF